MPGFSGFKDTTLVGKNDLTLGPSVKKKPLGRLPIHEYAVQPNVINTAQPQVSADVAVDIADISINAVYDNLKPAYAAQYQYIADKPLVSFDDIAEMVAIP